MGNFEINLTSPAKINLFLEVFNRRDDGYHNLESLMSFCDFGDNICISDSTKLTYKNDGDFGCELKLENNIIHKTILKVEKIIKKKININIKLTKNIPISSGMGGGSSNAATLLKFLIYQYNIKLKKLELDKLLISLGADVPFCYYGKTAMVRGIGEKINFVKTIPNYFVILVNPMVQISTKQIFNNLNSKKTSAGNQNNQANFIDYLKSRKNDLEAPAINQCNKIYKILDILKNQTNSLLSRMTGSGATCFGLYKKKSDINNAEKIIKDIDKDLWIKKTKILNQI